MNSCIKQIEKWLNRYAKLKQWLWFVVLWTSGLLIVTLIAYPIKWVIKKYLS